MHVNYVTTGIGRLRFYTVEMSNPVVLFGKHLLW